MIGKTNVGGGGGNAFAYIGVTYPVGSTCTCTNGVRTFTAKGTGGLYVFNIPYADDWTVTATDGTLTVSETIAITNQWQNVVANLTYWDGTLYDSGNEYELYTGGWESKQNVNYYYSSSSTFTNHTAPVFGEDTIFLGPEYSRICVAGTVNQIDLTNVDTINVVTTLNTGNGPTYIACDKLTASSVTINNTAEKYRNISSLDFDFDVSDLTGYYYVFIGMARTTSSGSVPKRYISKVKLNFSS